MSAAGAPLHELTATEAAAAIREKRCSPLELVEALLARIDATDARVKAWVLVDRDGARAEARRAADEAARGLFRGPLHGVPFGAKDIFYSAGLPTEAGSEILKGFVPTYDATSVARLKAAGAILLGKLHTTEFATFDPAPTRNPWNLEHTPGGSSSGSAAAVAARMVSISLGTQTVGSVIRPPSYCGLAGIKPTFGRVSVRGVVPLTWTQDHVGFMARSVEDLALVLHVIAGHDPADASTTADPVADYRAALGGVRAPRIGLLREFFLEQCDAEVARVTRDALGRLTGAGAAVEEVKLPPSFAIAHAAAWTIARTETAACHAELYPGNAERYRPGIRAIIESGTLIPGDLYLKALRLRRRFRLDMARLLERVDVLLTPTTPTPAPAGMPTGDPLFQVPWSVSGLPTVTVPCGLAASGLPLGLQLIAAPFAEAPLLAAAAWCEAVLGRLPAPSV